MVIGCSKRDISISQSRHPTSGIPEFIVQIVNTCVTGCPPSNIHVRCGWFASTRILNPITFKRLSYDDCLVNGGRPLKSSQSIRLTYANSFMYPFQFKSASFCWERVLELWELIGLKVRDNDTFDVTWFVQESSDDVIDSCINHVTNFNLVLVMDL